MNLEREAWFEGGTAVDSVRDIALRTTMSVALDEPIGERRILIEPENELLEWSISGRPTLHASRSAMHTLSLPGRFSREDPLAGSAAPLPFG